MTDSKNTAIAILSHLTIFGWIVAVVLNSSNKNEFTSFFIRQTLVLNLILALGFGGFFGKILAIVALVFLILSVISAIQGEKKEVPFIGNEFQNWFKGL